MNENSTFTNSEQQCHFSLQNAKNYVASSKPLNTNLDNRSSDIPCFSAGHTKHEWTSWACIDALFPYLEEKYAEFGKDDQSDDGQSDDQNDADKEKANEEKADKPSDQEEDNGRSNEEKVKNKSDQEKSDVKSGEKKADAKSGEKEEESADDGQSEPKKPNKREDL